jgi:2,3-bisphosphoglycerate-independent phosphoglycerate mutase
VKEYARVSCVPPHNIVGQQISRNLPRGKGEELLTRLMKDSKGLLERHEINKVRIDLKENPANMIWLWGQGTNPNLPTYKQLFGLTGSVISAVDLIKGIGRLVGLDVIDVPGATGYYDTNYKGKGEYAIEGLRQKDFVFVHVEAPDEAGHNGEMRAKIEAIENFDKYIVGPVWKFLKESRNYRVMILPDHATPISVRTHVDDPVPFVICGKLAHPNGAAAFNENAARATRLKFKSGFALTDYFIHHDRKRKR